MADQFIAPSAGTVRRGQARVALLNLVAIGTQRKRRGLGHAQASEHANAFAACQFSHFVKLFPHRLRQARTGKKDHVQVAEKSCAQDGVGLQGMAYFFKTFGHVEVGRGRDFTQLAQRLTDERGRSFAFV